VKTFPQISPVARISLLNLQSSAASADNQVFFASWRPGGWFRFQFLGHGWSLENLCDMKSVLTGFCFAAIPGIPNQQLPKVCQMTKNSFAVHGSVILYGFTAGAELIPHSKNDDRSARVLLVAAGFSSNNYSCAC
jgi:hypothetical protein